MAAPPLTVVLATYVRPREAAAFTRLVVSTGALNPTRELVLDDVLAAVQRAAAAALGRGARVTVAGSVAKGTQVQSSDLDLLVHSAAAATPAQLRKFEALLKAHPDANPAHVKLGKLAIHAQLFGVDCDVVCAATVEHGARPAADTRVAADKTVAGAARSLKLWAEQAATGSRKVPGHALEALALHCRGDMLSCTHVGDGAMQLCVTVLQRVADGGTASGVLRDVTRLDTPTRASLAARAQATLHVFALSRALLPGGCFRTAAEVRVWLVGSGHMWHQEDTLAGSVPGWLLRSPAQQRALDDAFAMFAREEVEDEVVESQQDGLRIESLRLLLASPLGAYAQAGSRATQLRSGLASSGLADELSQLYDLQAHGSAVARRMLRARLLWLEGEDAMRDGECARAAGHFAASMRAASDGDPFGGWCMQRRNEDTSAACERYTACAAAVLSRDARHVDALLMRSWALERAGRLAEAEGVLSSLVEHIAPNDVHGALATRAALRGNQSRWRESLADSERCVQLCPEEPTFHYWEATARRNLVHGPSDSAAAAAAIAAYRRFLAAAAPEGRKVCEALYAVASLQLVDLRERWPPAGTEPVFLATMRAAQAAEAAKLPIFAETDNEVKRTVLMIARAFKARGADGFVPRDRMEEVVQGVPSGGADRAAALRRRGNDAFGTRHFAEADEAYSRALETAPNDAGLLGNRAAARIGLRWYTAALADASSALAARPGWAKAHYRASQAHLGRRDGAAAAAAVRSAFALLPSDADVVRLQSEAQALEAAQRAVQPLPDVRSDSQLWACVAFKGNVHAVCAGGGAAFASVADALHQLTTVPPHPGVTLILHPGVYDEQLNISDARVQLLGWHAPGGAAEELRTELRCAPYTDDHGDALGEKYTLLLASGANADVRLERLVLTQRFGSPRTRVGHCVSCCGGAAVRVTGCAARTPDSPCFSVGGTGSRLALMRISVRRSSAGVVADLDASLECDACTFDGCTRAAIEARGGSCAVLRGCSFSNCAAQAAVLYAAGTRLELHDCSLRRCGKRPSKSAVLAECGTLLMRRCTLEDNGTGAIVLQAAEREKELRTAPVALLEFCTFARNDLALAVYLGSGHMLNCTAFDHAHMGVLIRGVLPHMQFALRGCTFARNGPARGAKDVAVLGDTLFERCVRLDPDNIFSTPPSIIPDAHADDIVARSLAVIAKAGLSLGGSAPAPAGAPAPHVGWQLPRERAVELHLEAIRALHRSSVRPDFVDQSCAEKRKPHARLTPPLLTSLTAISVAQLRPGMTHTGCVLRGTLIVPPLASMGLVTLLDDGAAGYVKLAVYNLLPPGARGMSEAERERAAALRLPKGARVAVVEPFFKLMVDGSYGVRVEDPRELVMETRDPGRPSMSARLD